MRGKGLKEGVVKMRGKKGWKVCIKIEGRGSDKEV